MAGYRTGCGVVLNSTSEIFTVLSPVGNHWITIHPGQRNTLNCDYLFWECADQSAVDAYALRFKGGSSDPAVGNPDFYMYMEHRTTRIVWETWPADYTQRKPTGLSFLGCINVRIVGAGRPFSPQVSVVW